MNASIPNNHYSVKKWDCPICGRVGVDPDTYESMLSPALGMDSHRLELRRKIGCYLLRYCLKNVDNPCGLVVMNRRSKSFHYEQVTIAEIEAWWPFREVDRFALVLENLYIWQHIDLDKGTYGPENWMTLLCSLTPEEAEASLHYLEGEGFVERICADGNPKPTIRVTPKGKIEFEKGLG